MKKGQNYPPTDKSFRSRLGLLRLQTDLSIESYRKELIDTQVSCRHQEIVEGNYQEEGIFSSAKPPFRVCISCGYAEEGWFCGYSQLDDDESVRRVSRDEASRYVIGIVLPNKIHSSVKSTIYSKGKSLRKILEEHQQTGF